MLTNNNNTPSSAPPPPPPPPPPGWKNTDKHNDKDGKSPSVTAEKSSSGTQLKRGLSKVSNPNFLEELQNHSKFKEANNANGETADKGSNIRQSEKNRSSTPKPVFPRVLSPQQDNGSSNKPFSNSEDSKRTKTIPDLSNSYNLSSELEENNKPLEGQNTLEERCEINTGQVVPKKPMTGQHNGVHYDSENQKSSVAEQKKATGLKYSIAILLLCTSGPVAVVYTYFIISAVLSSAAVPVSSAVIAFVSASVMLSLAAYLINSHLSAINSEKGVDPGRKQSQDLQKAKGLEHSNSANTPTSSLPVMSGTPSAPPSPPPPPEKSNDLSTAQRVIRKNSPSDANQKDVQQKQSGIPLDDRSNLLAEIKKGTTLKQVSDEQKKNYLPEDGKQESDVQSRNKGVHQIRKVENQKTDKEPNNSESMQQGDYMNDSFRRTVLAQRNRSGFQDEQLDSLDEQEDSLCSLEESLTEPKKPFNKEQKNYVQPLNASIVLRNTVSGIHPLLKSPSDNLSSNSGNAPDYDDWETQPQSIPYCNLDKTQQEMRQEKEKESDDFFTTTKVSDVNSEMQYPSTLSIKENIALFDQK